VPYLTYVAVSGLDTPPEQIAYLKGMLNFVILYTEKVWKEKQVLLISHFAIEIIYGKELSIPEATNRLQREMTSWLVENLEGEIKINNYTRNGWSEFYVCMSGESVSLKLDKIEQACRASLKRREFSRS